MTYLYLTTAYLLASPLLCTLHIANVYLCEWRANARAEKRRRDEVLMLEMLLESSERPRI